MPYNSVLVSATHQHESAIGIHVSSLLNLPPTSHSMPPSRLLQGLGLSSLGHTADSHWLPILHMAVYMFPCTFSIHPTLSFLPPQCVHKSVLYVCISIAVLQIGSSLQSFYIPYICVNIQYLFFSFGLTSLCIVGSRFIHLITTDSNAFLFKTE